MKYWIITDTHFAHPAIIDKYGRPSDFEILVDNSLRQIPETDVLIHLGDINLRDPAIVHHDHIQPLKCKKWLTLGNHDNKSINWYLTHGWDFAAERFIIPTMGLKIMFSHYPHPIPDGVDYNIHGHFHDNEHRRIDFLDMLNDQHLLLAIENTNFEALPLEDFFQLAITKNKK